MQAFYDLALYFFMFGFCGWACECIYCSLDQKKLVNRGFLNGPICPVYSFGGLLVVYVLEPVQDNIVLLFLLGMVSTTALEYLTSLTLEKLFKTSWWDYSNFPLNIGGRVCLLFSLIFGALSVVAVRLLYPPFAAIVGRIPAQVKPWLVWGLLAVFVADCVATVQAILTLNGKLAELRRITQELRQRLEALPEEKASFAERLEQLRSKRGASNKMLDSLVERFDTYRENFMKRYQHRRLIDAFPNMRSIRYQEQFSEVKAAFATFREKRLQKGKKKKGKRVDKR